MICCGKRSTGDVLSYKKNQEIEKKNSRMTENKQLLKSYY